MTSECDNIDVRDLLPDYVHDSLDASVRAEVEAHLALCPACTAELTLVRQALRAFPAPAVDTAAIVRAIGAAPQGGATVTPIVLAHRSTVRQSPWRLTRWRIAAGVTFLLVGGATAQLLRGRAADPESEASISDSLAAITPVSGPAAESLSARRAGGRFLNAGAGEWKDLSNEQLQQLLDAIDGAEAVPGIEPQRRMTPIMTSGESSDPSGGIQ